MIRINQLKLPCGHGVGDLEIRILKTLKMKRTAESLTYRIVRHSVDARKKPLLGICLGCQILLERSEENDVETLGILPGICRRFTPELMDGGQPIRIPHMGWNALRMKQDDPLFAGIEADAQYYFVHSYYTEPAEELIIATCEYGLEFTAAYGRPGLWALQFHPEKSGRPGLQILQNFYKICQEAAHV